MRYLCLLLAVFRLTSGRKVSEDTDMESLSGDNLDDFVQPSFRYALKDRTVRFANGVVPYVINSGFSASQIAHIKERMRIIESYTQSGDTPCITFRPKNNGDVHYLNIRTHSFKCLGIAGSRSSVYLARKCIPRQVIHELIHAIGFYHEHNRVDRNKYVKVLYSRVPLELRSAYNIQSKGTNQSIPYDYGSIMHYSDYLIPKRDNYIGGRRAALDLKMSELDVLRIQRFYGCQENNTEYNNAIQVKASCTFEDTDEVMCGMEQEKKFDNFDFIMTQPAAGRVSDRGHFLSAVAKNHQNTKARMRSNVLEPGCYRIGFAYQGSRLTQGNTIRVATMEAGEGARYESIRNINKGPGNFWTMSSSARCYKDRVFFFVEAVIGRNSSTDVLIDDIFIAKFEL